MEIFRAIIYYINSLTINIFDPYFTYTSNLILKPHALSEELGEDVLNDIEPAKYLIQAVLMITGIWSFGYLLTASMGKSLSWTFNLLLGFYFLLIPFVVSLMIKALKISSTPSVIIRNAYYSVVGAFAPPILFFIECNRIISHYWGESYNSQLIEEGIIISIGTVGVFYLLYLFKKILTVNIAKLIFIIIPLILVVQYIVTELFKYIIDVLKINGLM